MKIQCFILCLIFIHVTSSDSKKEEELPKDVLCAGCEATIKEISRRLTYNTKPVLEKVVPKVLRTICDEDNFRETEFSPSKVRAACKQLLKKQKSDITKALVEYYSKKKQSKSYLDLSQKVCSDTTGVCSRLTEDGKPAEGRVIFNDETQEFEVIMGENVRMPQPVVNPQIVEPAQKNNMADGMLRADPVKPLKHVPSSHDEL